MSDGWLPSGAANEGQPQVAAPRIADPRVLRLIERWLKAGILESGRWEPVELGRRKDPASLPERKR